jgi:hypothetical protein
MKLSGLVATATALALLISGCASPAPVEENKFVGKSEATVLDPNAQSAGAGSANDGGVADAAPGNGEIRGKILDDAGLPIRNALVSLLETEFSTKTDQNGSFRFANVTPGVKTLRIVATDYRVYEGKAEVRADRVTLMTVTLVPLSDRGPGYQQHLHDYWGANKELLLMDTQVHWSKGGTFAQNYGAAGEALTAYYQPNNGNWWHYFAIPNRADSLPPIVLPGTESIRITITWTKANADVDAFILAYKPANTGTYKEMPAVASGVERTLTITAEEADNGHQLFSLWQFRIKPAPRTTPMTIPGPIQVKMVQVKGLVPVEPAHEDFWNGTDTLVLRNFTATHRVSTNSIGGCAEYAQVTPLEKGKLVPPGTNRLAMRFEWRYSDATLAGTPADGEMKLFWKPANLRPDTPYDQFHSAEPKKLGARSHLYDIQVNASQTDAFYQKNSNWVFYPDRTDIREPCVRNWEYSIQWNLEITAYKDPNFL